MSEPTTLKSKPTGSLQPDCYARLLSRWQIWTHSLQSALRQAEEQKDHASAIRLGGQVDSMQGCIADLVREVEHNAKMRGQ
jgi:hypothetical protein